MQKKLRKINEAFYAGWSANSHEWCLCRSLFGIIYCPRVFILQTFSRGRWNVVVSFSSAQKSTTKFTGPREGELDEDELWPVNTASRPILSDLYTSLLIVNPTGWFNSGNG